MNLETVRKMIAFECGKAGGVEPWATGNDITAAYVHMLLGGTRDPGEKILAALGLERIVSYRKKNGSGK